MFHIHFSFHHLNCTKITHTSSFWILFFLINKMKVWRCILTLLTHYSQTAKINKIIMHVSLLPCFNSFFLFPLSRSCPWASSCVHQQFTASWLTTTFTLFEYWNGFCIGYWVDGLCLILWRRRSIQYIGWCCRSIRKFFL